MLPKAIHRHIIVPSRVRRTRWRLSRIPPFHFEAQKSKTTYYSEVWKLPFFHLFPRSLFCHFTLSCALCDGYKTKKNVERNMGVWDTCIILTTRLPCSSSWLLLFFTATIFTSFPHAINEKGVGGGDGMKKKKLG